MAETIEMKALSPSVTLIVKLGSIIVHADELISSSGHEFDREALAALLDDREVKMWLKQMTKLALVPVKRVKP